jgi:hypothetical protein
VVEKEAETQKRIDADTLCWGSIAIDFRKIGIMKISNLVGKNPEELYRRICFVQGGLVDRCVLYVCRSAVYFPETPVPDPEKLNWWNWKDKRPRPGMVLVYAAK